jgi:hypothetical protein
MTKLQQSMIESIFWKVIHRLSKFRQKCRQRRTEPLPVSSLWTGSGPASRPFCERSTAASSSRGWLLPEDLEQLIMPLTFARLLIRANQKSLVMYIQCSAVQTTHSTINTFIASGYVFQKGLFFC